MSLNRRTPLLRGKGLKRGSGLKRRVPLAPVSDKRQAQNRLRRTMVDALFPERPLCVVYVLSQEFPGVVPADVISRCRRWADDVHEPLTRARRGSITDPDNAVPPCRSCHDEITFKPESELQWAYGLGLLVHSWDAPKAGDAA
jgi:hypothetical protein